VTCIPCFIIGIISYILETPVNWAFPAPMMAGFDHQHIISNHRRGVWGCSGILEMAHQKFCEIFQFFKQSSSASWGASSAAPPAKQTNEDQTNDQLPHSRCVADDP
jgi:hypothetical protein